MFKERRLEPRETLALPLKLAHGANAVTRDLSAAGLFFVIRGQHVLSGPVEFEMQLPEFSLRFTAAGEIVRTEHGDGMTGVAVRFLDPHLDVLPESEQPRAGMQRDSRQAETTAQAPVGRRNTTGDGE